MQKIRFVIAGIIVLITLVACGDGFEARTLLSESEVRDVIDDAESEIGPGATPESVDKKIQSSYKYYTQYMNEDMMEIMDSTIRAFEVMIEAVEHPGGASEKINMVRVSMKTGCQNDSFKAITNRTITSEKLKSGAQVYLGITDKTSVRIQCTSVSCEELVAGVTMVLPDSNMPKTVLIGLQKSETRVIGNTSFNRYTSREVNEKYYINKTLSIAVYNREVCLKKPSDNGYASSQDTSSDPDYVSNHVENNSAPSIKTVIDPTDF